MRHTSERALAVRGAAVIASGFDRYRSRLKDLSRSSRRNFERRLWREAQKLAVVRLELYGRCLDEVLADLGEILGTSASERDTWIDLRSAYAAAIAARENVELAETFFNSVSRRIFHTVGVDPSVEFVSTKTAAARAATDGEPVTVTFERRGAVAVLIREILTYFTFDVPWEDPGGDAKRIAEAVSRDLVGAEITSVVMARPVLFRGKGAYLVGKILTDVGDFPLLLALTNPGGRIVVDAALTDENETSIVFSFARSYFAVDAESPGRLAAFLRTIMPRKPLNELYNAIGWNKHGKTELYRSILHHLETTDDRFEIAPGQRGMVMSVFTLPRLDVVFKVIRDRFDPPKTVTHAEVVSKYRLVFRHDRAGRLVDAQEFEHLAFARDRFAPDLLEQLATTASERVTIDRDKVVLRHLYTERRLRPLDVFLKGADPAAARDAVIDYGQALRDLAASNIFPGDMLLKNFGVSRHGRLIFYDYDELCLLTDCRFRRLPASRDVGEGGGEEANFYVDDRDIFPEEFRSFLGMSGPLLDTFLSVHGELLEVAFWHRMQETHRRGDVLDIYPYRPIRRLRRDPGNPVAHDGPHHPRS